MESKKVLITGGTKGIGWAVAQLLLARGYSVIATYEKDEQRANELESAYSHAGQVGILKCIKADISAPECACTLMQEMDRLDFVPDILIFNAGLTYRGSIFHTPREDWYRVFEANVHFPFKLIQLLAPHMSQGSMILFTGSLMAIHPHSTSLSYGVTKSAVHSMVQNLVKELEPLCIRVAGIAPGFVDTEWQKEKPSEIRHNIESKVALHRFVTPEEVAQAYLGIIDNEYFNGDILTLSGGYSYR